ncbi:MAG: hypothetical protein ACK2TV_12375 [Anaerolineales bacterium]
MSVNGNAQQIILVDEGYARQLQWEHCGELLDEISERHDPKIGEVESRFRELVGREDDGFEVVWQQLDLAIQDMYLEMVARAFWEGARLGLRLQVRELVVVGNGRAHSEMAEVV